MPQSVALVKSRRRPCGAGGASIVMGGYLLLCLNVFGKHSNEAFSSLRIEGFKNFLRMRISCGGTLTLFPIGLSEVPRDDTSDPPRNPPLRPHLIEKPIQIA